MFPLTDKHVHHIFQEFSIFLTTLHHVKSLLHIAAQPRQPKAKRPDAPFHKFCIRQVLH